MKRSHMKTLLLGLAGTALVVSGGAVVVCIWMGHAGRSHIIRTSDELSGEQVAIVPGASVRPGDGPLPALEDRLQCALDLYRSGKVSRILVSGDPTAPEGDEVEVMRHWLEERGVEQRDLLQDRAGYRTLDTMLRARRVFGISNAVICTQRLHLPRSIWLARRAGIEAVGLAADRRAYSGRLRQWIREMSARCLAFMDVFVLHTQPAEAGEQRAIQGDGSETR